MDCLRSGVLGYGVLCRSGVRTKPGINMVVLEESEITRFGKEGRIGPSAQGGNTAGKSLRVRQLWDSACE